MALVGTFPLHAPLSQIMTFVLRIRRDVAVVPIVVQLQLHEDPRDKDQCCSIDDFL